MTPQDPELPPLFPWPVLSPVPWRGVTYALEDTRRVRLLHMDGGDFHPDYDAVVAALVARHGVLS